MAPHIPDVPATEVFVGVCSRLAFPEEHRVLLVLGSLLALGGEEFTGLFLLDLVDFTESSATEFLDYLETTIKDLLVR